MPFFSRFYLFVKTKNQLSTFAFPFLFIVSFAMSLQNEHSGAKAAAEEEEFAKLVAEYGDPDDVSVVAQRAGDKVPLTAVRASNNKSKVTFETCPLKTTYVEDTGEGSYASKSKYAPDSRPKAKYGICLSTGALREETAKDTPLLLGKQRAFFAYGRQVCRNILGKVFDYPGESEFSELKRACIEDATKIQEQVMCGRMEEKLQKTLDESSKEYDEVVRKGVSESEEIQKKILNSARNKFIGAANNPFAELPGDPAERPKPLHLNRKVYTVRRDKLTAYERGKRPLGPDNSVVLSEETWLEIRKRMEEEYVWNPYKYISASDGKEIDREKIALQDGQLKERLEEEWQAECEAERKKERKAKADGKYFQASKKRHPLDDPMWSPIDGKKWVSLVSMRGFLDVYKLPSGSYGVSAKPFGEIVVYDRVKRSEDGAGTVTASTGAFKALVRKIGGDDDDDDDKDEHESSLHEGKRRKLGAAEGDSEIFPVDEMVQ